MMTSCITLQLLFFLRHFNLVHYANITQSDVAFLWCDSLLLTLASCDFCRLLITFDNNLDPDQDGQDIGLDLDPNRLTP